jgi:hypothetical protein
MDIKCLNCVAVHKKFVSDQTIGSIPEEFPEPVVNDAITYAPSWQQQVVAGTLVMACIAIPVCVDHVEVAEMTAEQRAVQGGRLLQGTVKPG